jgi:Spy/CpxP family protein refolding chaperone
MRWMKTSLMTAVLLATTAPVVASPGGGYGADRHAGPPGGFGGPGEMFGGDPQTLIDRLSEHADRMADLLDLTADQRSAFDRLKQDSLDQVKTKLDAARADGDELRVLLDSSNPDPATVGAKAIALHQTRSDLRDLRKTFEDEFSKILTDQQRFAFEKLREARRFDSGPGGMHGPGGPGGPGFGRRFDRRPPPPDPGQN